MRYSLTRTEPSAEPVTLARAKAHCRVDYSDDDALLSSLIVAARSLCEERTRRWFITSTGVMKLDEFPAEILIPRAPLVAVSSIAYLDDQGASQTLSSTYYRVDAASHVGRITLAYGYEWPGTYPVSNAVTVTFTAGYGTTADDTPEAVKLAILMLVAQWYEHREPTITGTMVTPMPMAVDYLLGPYRVAEALS
jgi:uncharacterized phiE125 gp8 family phage protein